jgi:GalNAc5-diNAcBac-PP-undecaprenol beta-1,3-glucosyltransferase
VPEATVIVPTHEHAWTLPHAVGSALSQTVSDIEVAIIGDGATPQTRAAAEALAGNDSRVRFTAREKSPGHGFAYRDEAVRQASSDAIFYLSDDDLWFPEHIEVVGELLRSAGFAAALTVTVDLEGPRIKHPTDLALEHYRTLIRDRLAVVQLSATAHTREAYLRLPLGWRVPDPAYNDFWREFVTTPGIEVASAPRPTVLQFTSPPRRGMTQEERGAEVARWVPALSDIRTRLQLTEALLSRELSRSAGLTARLEAVSRKLSRARARAKRQVGEPQSGSSAASPRNGASESRSERIGDTAMSGHDSRRSGSSQRTPNSSSASQ